MAIVQRIKVSRFIDAFVRAGQGRVYSRAGLGVLYEYLSEESDSMGTDLVLDVPALAMEYYELDLDEARDDYGGLEGYPSPDEESMATVVDWFAERTLALPVDESRFIIECNF